MKNADGRTNYVAQAYVQSDSGINTFSQLKNKRSCHTGFKKSAGMYMPIGYAIRNNIMEDKGTLQSTVTSFFTAGQCAPPVLCGLCQNNRVNGQCTGDPYSDYDGAIRCLR